MLRKYATAVLITGAFYNTNQSVWFSGRFRKQTILNRARLWPILHPKTKQRKIMFSSNLKKRKQTVFSEVKIGWLILLPFIHVISPSISFLLFLSLFRRHLVPKYVRAVEWTWKEVKWNIRSKQVQNSSALFCCCFVVFRLVCLF